MIPYDPWSMAALWFTAWREQVRKAKEKPELQYGHCYAAVICQAQYVTYEAAEKAENAKRQNQ